MGEGNLGFASAESGCNNGKTYAKYLVWVGGLNVGLELKIGNLFEFLSEISKLTFNATSLLLGKSFTLGDNIPKKYVSNLNTGALQGILFLSLIYNSDLMKITGVQMTNFLMSILQEMWG